MQGEEINAELCFLLHMGCWAFKYPNGATEAITLDHAVLAYKSGIKIEGHTNRYLIHGMIPVQKDIQLLAF